MEILPEEKEIISEFEIFDNWMEKYEYLIELGKDLPIIDASHKNDKNLIIFERSIFLSKFSVVCGVK